MVNLMIDLKEGQLKAGAKACVEINEGWLRMFWRKQVKLLFAKFLC
jgi:hypothetical protein